SGSSPTRRSGRAPGTPPRARARRHVARLPVRLRGQDGRDRAALLRGCSVEHVVAALGLDMRDLFETPGRPPRWKTTGKKCAPSPPPDDGVGLTLDAYAAAKRLPIEKLKGWGLVERKSPYPPYRPCVQMP